MKLDEVLSEDERLDLWIELNVLATQILEFADWWWRLDPGLRQANDRRAGMPEDEDAIPE
ncbi:MAG: hypothetical protein AAF550_10070 [Myxococcota bacterium]